MVNEWAARGQGAGFATGDPAPSEYSWGGWAHASRFSPTSEVTFGSGAVFGAQAMTSVVDAITDILRSGVGASAK
jgi:hypothetical protein